MRVVDRFADFEYVLMDDREVAEEEKTTWVLRGLTYDIQQALEARVSPQINMQGASLVGGGEGGYQKAMENASVSVDVAGGRTELQFDILRHGIVSVSNLIDSKGNQVEYPGPKAPSNSLKNWFAKWLESEIRTELANVIIEGSTLTEEDVKN